MRTLKAKKEKKRSTRPRKLLPKLPLIRKPNLNLPITLVNTPEVNRHAGDDERHDDQRLQRLRDDRAAEQENTNTAEDNGRRDPGLIRPFQVRFPDAEDDQAQNREEVESVTRDAVEGD